MSSDRFLPLTERILRQLPGPQGVWIALWAAVPWLNAGANLLQDEDARSVIWEQSDVMIVLSYAAMSFAVAITLWGAKRIARRLGTLLSTSEVLRGEAGESFRELNSVTGPLVGSATVAVAFGLGQLIEGNPAGSLLRVVTWFVVGLALFTFVWTYVSLQLGLDRLGRKELHIDSPLVDPGLGLQPLGRVAFMGLWMLLVWLVPVLLTALPDIVGVVLGLIVLVTALASFFLSLLRLHRQMSAVKAKELETARALYAQAYEPVRSERTANALERQHHLLQAADGLERRAREIHDWPIDEGIVARVATIATSVLAITVARLILDPVGL